MSSKDIESKRFDVASGLPPYKVKLTAEEAIGFGHLMSQLNKMEVFEPFMDQVAKKFFDEAQKVSKRALPDKPADFVASVGEQMKMAAESGDEGCEVELSRTELVIFSGFFFENFGTDAKVHDPVIGDVIDRIVLAGKETVDQVNSLIGDLQPNVPAAKA